jgi:hypothetical protein
MPNPWGGAMVFPVVALMVLLAFVYVRRAPVRRKPSSGGLLIGVASGIALAAVLHGLASAGQTVGVPTPHLVAAAVAAVVFLLVAGRARRGAQATLRRAGRPT